MYTRRSTRRGEDGRSDLPLLFPRFSSIEEWVPVCLLFTVSILSWDRMGLGGVSVESGF